MADGQDPSLAGRCLAHGKEFFNKTENSPSRFSKIVKSKLYVENSEEKYDLNVFKINQEFFSRSESLQRLILFKKLYVSISNG